MYTSNISVLLSSMMCAHLVSTDVVYEHRLYTDNNTDDIGGYTLHRHNSLAWKT